ncbi:MULTISPECIES: thioredoxin family protein [Cytobacillus]|uniref:thioredoxin family protein n=1 Tax=Cytobacillus TaxID=2675230 RepID=UPI00203EA53C|nr:thioredoxin family protein [Cytobacillus firmus]MCM3708762.1 thioredoxin family protein [Cytobacillus firmus]
MKKNGFIFFIAVFLIVLVLVVTQNIKGKEITYDDITIEDYKDKINPKEDFYVYIYSPNCHTCEEFSPTLDKALNQVNVELFALDVSKDENNNKDFFKQYGISVTPTLILYKDGNEVGKMTGNIPYKELLEFLK